MKNRHKIIEAILELNKKLSVHHKELLTIQTHEVEIQDATRYSPYAVLNLSLQDPRFDWLRHLSKLITRIDIFTEDENFTSADLATLADEVTRLLGGEDELFFAKYLEAFKDNAHLFVTQAEVKKALTALKNLI